MKTTCAERTPCRACLEAGIGGMPAAAAEPAVGPGEADRAAGISRAYAIFGWLLALACVATWALVAAWAVSGWRGGP